VLALTEIFSPHWAIFIVAVVAFLALDLGVFHREARVVSFREAGMWTAICFAAAMAFAYFIAPQFVTDWGPQQTDEFVTGYILELSLSMDNVFVIAVIFGFFRVPSALQHRVLFWGILTALFLRGAMIFAGTALLQRFHWMLYVFGAFLLFTGAKLLFHKEEEHSPEHSLAFRALRRVIPATPALHGKHFFVHEGGRRVATPLFLCLALIEISDVVFALDSVPAIFGVTLDPFIVFTSNIFAILGLRSLYFAIASLIGRFEYLKIGLSFVLVFIGAKMTLSHWVHIGSFTSLAVVAGLLGGSIVFSILKTRRLAEPERPGSTPGA
jgi:tellurite resistance protein TerC